MKGRTLSVQEVVFGFGAHAGVDDVPELLHMAQQADRDGLDIFQETGMSINSVGVEMGARDKGVGVPGCWKGDDYQCSGARRFPDGSIALYKEFRSEYQGAGEMTHSYSVNLIRPDGTEIHVYSEVVYQPDRPRNALLSLPRLMQIARGITVTP
jgi:hypothetical protein